MTDKTYAQGTAPIDMTVEEVLDLACRMHPNHTRAYLKERLMSGKGIEVKLDYLIKRTHRLMRPELYK